MLSVLSCIAYEHDPFYLALAVLVLTTGGYFTLRLYARVRRSVGTVKLLWVVMAGLIGGGTIWTTHFLSMLAYESDLIHGYSLGLTVLSLVVVIAGVCLGFLISDITDKPLSIEAGGAIVGLSASTMHYVGLAAMEVSGRVIVEPNYVIASVLLGGLFSALMLNRISKQCSRFCGHVAVILFVLCVTSIHFVSMTGTAIIPSGNGAEPIAFDSKGVLAIAVLLVMALLFLSVFMAYMIDAKTEEATDGRIHRIFEHDALTGLLNRSGMNSAVASVLQRATSSPSAAAVISFSLDRFLDIRDAHGQKATDSMLRHVAKLVSGCLGENESLGRVGDCEFLVLASDVYNKREVNALCARIEAVLGTSFRWGGGVLPVRAAFGYAFFPSNAREAGELIDKAEQAMKHACRSGPGTVAPFKESLGKTAKERGALSIDLSHAEERGELELYYQIQNNVNTREVTGAEVLLRWKHDKLGMVPPYKFIPIAEETGLINAFGPWILHTACKEAASWDMPLKIAVNVSSVQLSKDGFADIVARVLRSSGLDPARLELEITESGLLDDRNHAMQVIQDLKSLGVGIAMDDFGTGYSSLATLQMFPFDKIKIDREFVKDLGKNKHSAAIIRSTIILAESLDIPVLAEGVETEEQLQFLASEGCGEAQGYLFGRPMPVEEIRKITNARPMRPALSLVG